MPLVPFKELMADAERGQYAVGYFENWDLESVLAVADAAEAVDSPVLLGFSGIYLPHAVRGRKERLRIYAALGEETCRNLSVPACLVFNESSNLDWVLEAIDLGFGLVMFSDEALSFEEHQERVCRVVEKAHRASVAVEGEMTSLPGVSGNLSAQPEDLRLTEPTSAFAFVTSTGIDAFAVNVGQVHLHGRSEVRLSLSRVAELRNAVPVPLVLHGASSVRRADLTESIRLGVRKINVGSMLKRCYFEALQDACGQISGDYNPYEVVGSGLDNDVLAAARGALHKTVEDLMHLFGSAGKAR